MKRTATILVADDDPHLRAAAGLRLKALGLKVIEAENGIEVLRDYLSRQADFILLDQELPDCDGRTIAKFIRKESAIPIIFLSNYPAEEFRAIVHHLSDVYFLRKPIDGPKLAHLVNALWPN